MAKPIFNGPVSVAKFLVEVKIPDNDYNPLRQQLSSIESAINNALNECEQLRNENDDPAFITDHRITLQTN